MTRTAQYLAVIGILVVCLALTAFGAIGTPTSGPPPIEPHATLALARLGAVEPALGRLLPAARRYAAEGDGAAREAFGRALARFAEVSAAVERVPAGASTREEGALIETLRGLVPRVHLLALEIAAISDPQAGRAATRKLARLERLAEKTRAALDQLREAGPLRATVERKIPSLAPGIPGSSVPEGVAVLLLTLACAVTLALGAARRRVGR